MITGIIQKKQNKKTIKYQCKCGEEVTHEMSLDKRFIDKKLCDKCMEKKNVTIN